MNKWKNVLAMLGLIAATSWLAVASAPDKKLHLIACDVGQGDAILAVYGNTQILVDGGKGSEVIDCLESHLPFWDREIEVVVITHPQKDHFGGIIDVFKSYKVDKLVSTSIDSSSSDWQVLKSMVGGSATEVVNPTAGMVVGNSLMQLDIVWPTYEFLAENTTSHSTSGEAIRPPQGRNADWQSTGVLGSATTLRDPNDFSVVTVLHFGEFDALLTGDIGPEVTDEILATGQVTDVEYIKIPHHGSKNGLTQELLDASTPEVAVISVGKNSYGHPHEEVIRLLSDQGIKILRTDEEGDIEVVSDGEKSWTDN